MKSATTIDVSVEMKEKVIKFIKQNGFITNRQCRLLLGIGFEQAITLFNNLVGSGELIREGKTSSVKYRLSIKQKKPRHRQAGLKKARTAEKGEKNEVK